MQHDLRHNVQLTIIIPVYNVEPYLSFCLDSMIKEISVSVGLLEIIIVDDGSTDGSGQIADKYAQEYGFMQVIHKENMGAASARNTGLKAAGGDWVYFVDPDDWMAENGLSFLLQGIREFQDADMILFDAYRNVGNKEMAWEHFEGSRVWQDGEELRRLQRGVLYVPSAGFKTKVPLAAPWDKLYKRSFLQKCHIRFQDDLKVLDDMFFNMEVFGAAGKIAYYKEKIYHYRTVPDSVTNGYRPDRIQQDLKVWQKIRDYMAEAFKGNWTKQDKAAFLQAYYCRVVKSFSIACRLCFFNGQDKKCLKDKVKYLKTVLKSEVYKEAFQKVKLSSAQWQLKPVILMGRGGMGYGIYLLHLADTWGRKLQNRGSG